eukprot:2175624-Prymnesium_polylepis.1
MKRSLVLAGQATRIAGAFRRCAARRGAWGCSPPFVSARMCARARAPQRLRAARDARDARAHGGRHVARVLERRVGGPRAARGRLGRDARAAGAGRRR